MIILSFKIFFETESLIRETDGINRKKLKKGVVKRIFNLKFVELIQKKTRVQSLF